MIFMVGGSELNYTIRYLCWSHTGKYRKKNEDNYICDGNLLNDAGDPAGFPLQGTIHPGSSSIAGVFDGMGGEACGEIASLIAAREAKELRIGGQPLEDLERFFRDANNEILQYAGQHTISAMGTTAALLAFTAEGILLGNIGDSKVFRFSRHTLKQLSEDHYSFGVYGKKPPLSQNLGIPEDELILEPYYAKGCYHDQDIYLICTDGLTDMVDHEEIQRILSENEFNDMAEKLLNTALAHGGKDNITFILCRIEKV